MSRQPLTTPLPVFIGGVRQTGRTTKLLDQVMMDQERDPDLVAYIVSPYYQRAARHVSGEVMDYIQRWLDGEPGIDPQRTECWSVESIIRELRGRRADFAQGLYIDDSGEIRTEMLYKLLDEARHQDIHLRAMVM